MPATAAVYLTDTDINFALHFKDLKEEGSCCGHPELLYADLGGTKVRFDVLHGQGMADNVSGLETYISKLPDDEDRRRAATALLEDVALVLRLETEAEWNDEMWQALAGSAETLDGILFAFDSLILPSGAVLVGPLRKKQESIREEADYSELEAAVAYAEQSE